MAEGKQPYEIVARCPRMGALRKVSKTLGVAAIQTLCDKHVQRLEREGYRVETIMPLEAKGMDVPGNLQCQTTGRFRVAKGGHDDAKQGAQQTNIPNP